jgi:hypothetical protein
MVMLK